MPVQTREALQALQRFFTRRSADAPNIDQFSVVPLLTIPIDRTFDQVQPGVFTSLALSSTIHKFTWPPVPDDESHVYENISVTQDGATRVDVVLAVQGTQAGISWSRIYASIGALETDERRNLLALGATSAPVEPPPTWHSGSPLRLYSGEELVVRFLTAPSLNAVARFDWLRRIRQSPFTFVVKTDAVAVT